MSKPADKEKRDTDIFVQNVAANVAAFVNIDKKGKIDGVNVVEWVKKEFEKKMKQRGFTYLDYWSKTDGKEYNYIGDRPGIIKQLQQKVADKTYKAPA